VEVEFARLGLPLPILAFWGSISGQDRVLFRPEAPSRAKRTRTRLQQPLNGEAHSRMRMRHLAACARGLTVNLPAGTVCASPPAVVVGVDCRERQSPLRTGGI
jgi:hypothetical protein